jgi:hypothetical protein
MKWWHHPGLWITVGALAYPLGQGIGRVLVRRHTGSSRGYAFGA